MVIPGWQVSNAASRKFFFTGERGSYGAALGKTQDLGVIEAVFFREKLPYRVERRWKEEDGRIPSNEKDRRLDAPDAQEPAGAAQAPAPSEGAARDHSQKSLLPPSPSPSFPTSTPRPGWGDRRDSA